MNKLVLANSAKNSREKVVKYLKSLEQDAEMSELFMWVLNKIDAQASRGGSWINFTIYPEKRLDIKWDDLRGIEEVLKKLGYSVQLNEWPFYNGFFRRDGIKWKLQISWYPSPKPPKRD